MSEAGKRGSSRRKGDEYQDLTALRLALDSYITRKPFEMFLEYEQSGNLDDIVIFQGTEVFAYQVKYAVNTLDVYESSDFIAPESPVSLRRLADSWKAMRVRFPGHQLSARLCSNRALHPSLVDLVTSEGKFTQDVIEDRRRGDAKKLRSELASASGLDVSLFSLFLMDFQFVLRQPTLLELEEHIRTVLLDKELGLSDGTIFLELKDAVKHNAIFSRDAITAESIDNLLERLQSKLLIPQVFPINKDHFVEQKHLSVLLDRALLQINSGYLIVTGLPGSGKSTSLTQYFERLHRKEFEVFSYYCFVGVNDNAQRMRVEAESLRANLLCEFHRRYPGVLKRRFDYSERNFLECLSRLAKFFVDQGRRFIIFLDGLDHAERLEAEVRNSVISAMPSDIPQGVTIVVGTQELHKWPYFLKQARERPDNHIEMPLFSQAETRDYLENKRCISGLSHADIIEIHKKCEGLPLYERYVAEILTPSESLPEAIASLAPASGGDIRNYYGLLWDEFERVGMGEARHLCIVIACTRFNVHRDEFYSIAAIARPAFEDAFKCIRHLLRDFDARLTVFHNSFREFVISQVSNGWVKEILRNICSFLKASKDTSRWFGHVFRYCYDAEDYSYVVETVNADFVDRALLHCRPSQEILDAIHWAVESAFRLEDVVQLSRLGALRFRTGERLEHNLNRALLADALLAQGREQDVISFAYSAEAEHWLVESHTSLAVLSRLGEEKRWELGRRLFKVFTDEFRGIQSDNVEEERLEVVGIARCLGMYSERQARPLRWLSGFTLVPRILEQKDLYAPGYAPHLAAYIDALVQFGHTEKWKRLKRLKILFPNNLVRYLMIRAFAHHNILQELRVAVAEYAKQKDAFGNIELAFYAAKAGMPTAVVSSIAGPIEAPKTLCPYHISQNDPILRHYAYSFIVMAYEDNEDSYTRVSESFGKAQTLWNSALRHLLKACYCIGRSFRSVENDWFEIAQESISVLVEAQQGEGERIIESIELIRQVLPLSIGLLTEQVIKCFPEVIAGWVECLHSLRDSMLWTTHFGIMESIQNYDFELTLWETLAQNPALRLRLSPILKDCAETYERSTNLKGESRSRHFMRLAAIMAKCGMRDGADEWLRYGIRSSLIYGYHKDVTLLYLIDILNLVNQRQPKLALERCGQVLSMVDWMPHLTDGRETKRFPERAFSAVLSVNRQAAFDLLKHFSRSKARWKMQDCLEEYLLAAADGDPEYLWCLTELFANHFSDDGRHCKQIMGTRNHIIELVRESYSEERYREFESRFRRFVLTEITPRHWPEHLKREFDLPTDPDSENVRNTDSMGMPKSEFMLDGNPINREAITEKCRGSFSEFLTILDKLKNQNEHFYDRDLVSSSLRHHIAAARSSTELVPIKEYLESQGRFQDPIVIEELAERFLELVDDNEAIACFGMAYSCYGGGSFFWRTNAKYLAAVAVRDKQAATALVLKECYESASGSGGGHNTPAVAAAGLNVLDEPRMLQDVFIDFLIYCESMFAQLPKKEDYAWLKEYRGPSIDENRLYLDVTPG